MTESEPVRLVEDGDTGDRFLIYGGASGISIEVRYAGDALWMTQAQISDLFGRDVSVISRHISGILEDGELDESNLQKVQIASSAKPVTLYNLDMVISVGYRVSSKQATLFRRWATDKLVQFATKGFVVDVRRLKTSSESDRIAELREIIRDIRADEANVYRELRQICALCQDYDGASTACRDFYIQMQTKLLWAVTSKTPAELIFERANATVDHMGSDQLAKSEHSQIRCLHFQILSRQHGGGRAKSPDRHIARYFRRPAEDRQARRHVRCRPPSRSAACGSQPFRPPSWPESQSRAGKVTCGAGIWKVQGSSKGIAARRSG